MVRVTSSRKSDGPPLPDPLLRRGTSNWNDPEEILYSREYVLQIPTTLAPGEYTLVSGFYRRDNGQRLLTPTGEDSLWVTRIEVEYGGMSWSANPLCRSRSERPFWPRRNWWLALLAILVLAGGLRFPG